MRGLKSCLVLSAVASAALATAADAAVITVNSVEDDYEPQYVISTNSYTTSNGASGYLRIGYRTSDTLVSAVYVFPLPALPAGETVDSATVSLRVVAHTANLPSAYNVDLYGLPYDAAPFDMVGTRYYTGPNDTTSGVVKLEDNFLVPSEAGIDARHDSVDIGDYIQSLYDAGAQPGDFAVLRLSADGPIPTDANNRYQVWQRSSATSDDLDRWPILEITTVPEPSALALLGLGGLLLRRRK